MEAFVYERVAVRQSSRNSVNILMERLSEKT